MSLVKNRASHEEIKSKIIYEIKIQIKFSKYIRTCRETRPHHLNVVSCTLCSQSNLGQVIKNALIYFSLTVKAATLIFISGRGSAISSALEGKSGSIHNVVKN